jgi:hypothetical protein
MRLRSRQGCQSERSHRCRLSTAGKPQASLLPKPFRKAFFTYLAADCIIVSDLLSRRAALWLRYIKAYNQTATPFDGLTRTRRLAK